MRARFSFDPEFAGDEETIRVQARILNDDSWISDNTGLISRGTRVTVLDACRRTEESMIEIARRFESAIFILHAHQQAAFTSHLEGAGFHTAAFLHFSSSQEAFDRSDTIASQDLPAQYGLEEVRVDASSSAAMITGAQRLMVLCGLPAIPGYFLRGLTHNNLSIILIDRAQEVVGSVIAMDESRAGPDFCGWYFPGAVAVAPKWQGKGLGRWLNARAIQAARREGCATFVHEGVSPSNLASQAMILSCGLEWDESSIPLMAAASPPPKAWR